ncbi:MAG: hypothetical protein RIT45_3820 [Pseudomonadota bacterium]
MAFRPRVPRAPGSRRWRPPAVAVVLVLATTAWLPRAGDAAETARSLTNEVNNVSAAVRHTASEVNGTIARERRFPYDKRYVDATLAFGRGNHAVASVLLVDLIYKPQFQRTRDYYDALYMLGTSLYKQRNYQAAKRYLELVARKPGGKYFEDSIETLVDVAIRLRRYKDVSQYATFLGQIPPGKKRAALLYQFGRSFLAAGMFDEARKYLGQVSVGENVWAQARFYLGAILAHLGKPEEAMREFRDVLQAAKSADAAQRPPTLVLDFANMALARLLLDAKNYDGAILAYRAVGRGSQLYETAMFELAAAYVAAGRPRDALGALDQLLISAKEDQIAVEAAVLRGRINLMLREYDAADGAYKDVVDRFSAINGELTRFSRSTELLEQFFNWLLLRGGNDLGVVRPVSERVSHFIERDPDMSRVIALFDEMSAEKRDVKESAQLAASLSAALGSSARIEMFPAMRDKWIALLAYENQLVMLGQRATMLAGKRSAGTYSGDEANRIAGLERLNKKLYEAFKRIPATARDYNQRQSRVDNALNESAAQISLLRSNLTQLRDELMATEKLLNERVFGANAAAMPKEKEEALRAELDKEKMALRQLAREVDDLQRELELDASRMGSGDAVDLHESRIRGALLANQRALQAAYLDAARRAGKLDPDSAELTSLRARIDETLIAIGVVFRTIDQRVSEKTKEIAIVLQQEKANIAQYQISVGRYETDSRRLAREIGYTMIRRAQARLADIVLEADLGLVDVAWQRKQEKAATIRQLQDERSSRLRTLQNTLESLTTDEDEEEAAE